MSSEQLQGYESRRSHSGLPTSSLRSSLKQLLRAHWAQRGRPEPGLWGLCGNRYTPSTTACGHHEYSHAQTDAKAR